MLTITRQAPLLSASRGYVVTICSCQRIALDAPRGVPGTQAGAEPHPGPGRRVLRLNGCGGADRLTRRETQVPT